MKIAISGKGGVGKTLLASLLSRTFAEAGYSVLAIDADPDANLASALGVPDAETIMPISDMKELVEERTGVPSGKKTLFFKLNPKVDDLPEKYSRKHNGVRVMVMGRVKQGGTGCYCPENALLKALMSHLLIARDEVVILDMEAGIEHLGRATANAVDILIVVVEPGRRSIETAQRIAVLAKEIGLNNLAAVANKVRSQTEREFIISSLPDFKFLGFIPYDQALIDADLANLPLLEASPKVAGEVRNIYKALLSAVKSPDKLRKAES
ncbi:MAG: carbon monoxide dehydrogenase accessory protein CooC [Dehalococcoidia bacterium]|jgi:CO dehydrogenase maturation factor